MKYKGKIIQIIEEKEASNFIMVSKKNLLPNYDYLNIRPAEEREVPKKYRINWFISMILCMVSMVIFSKTFLPFIFFVLLMAFFFLGRRFIENYRFRDVKGLGIFEGPIPVEKPHNYKVGDIVEIELNLNHIQNEKM